MKTATRGFTLIELLVALVIFAIMSAGVFSVFNSFSRAKDVTDKESERLYAYQKAFSIMGRDIQQIVARPILDEFGDVLPALKGDESVLEFTRAGWNRPPFITTRRSELQRVRYVLEEQGLQREHWLVLDRADNSEPTKLEILDGIEDIKIRYYSANQQKQLKEAFNWPSADLLNASSPGAASVINQGAAAQQKTLAKGNCGIKSPVHVALPLLIEITLETKEFGELVKRYLINNSYDSVYLSRC